MVDRGQDTAQAPRRAAPGQLAPLVAVMWVVSPIDLLPEFLPVIGPLDDMVAGGAALQLRRAEHPTDTLLGDWPGDPRRHQPDHL